MKAMKDDWAKRLKDSLEGDSESVDDRVWERISPSPSAPRFIWWPFALAAAAVALVVFLFMPRGSVPEEDIVAVIQRPFFRAGNGSCTRAGTRQGALG